jgi:urease subunit alpha
VIAVEGTRGLTRSDLARNRTAPPIEIDSREGRVTLAGRPLEVAAATDLPLNRRYFLR